GSTGAARADFAAVAHGSTGLAGRTALSVGPALRLLSAGGGAAAAALAAARRAARLRGAGIGVTAAAGRAGQLVDDRETLHGARDGARCGQTEGWAALQRKLPETRSQE